jgi:hypothetical protein
MLVVLVRSLAVRIVVEVLTLMAPTVAPPANLDVKFLLGLSLRLIQDLFHDNPY